MSGTCLFALVNEWLQPGNYRSNLHHEYVVLAQAVPLQGLVSHNFP